MPLLEVEAVHKAFDGKIVLRDLSLQVGLHEVVALIGASGSGKSTLLRCVDGLVPVDAGRIWIGGAEARLEVTAADADLDAIRRRVGIVFQHYNLFPHMNVLANITLAPRKVLKLSAAQAEERARGLLGRFGLADKADDYPDRLSGGQQQRVAIVRALAMQPQLMLFDEVTSALDPQLVGEVLDVIRELKSTGMTIVMATHEMGFAREVADRVAFLHAGRVLEEAPPEELFGSPRQPQTREFLLRVHAPGFGG
jgi:polar amino acid transport system ATP-binding protein